MTHKAGFSIMGVYGASSLAGLTVGLVVYYLPNAGLGEALAIGLLGAAATAATLAVSLASRVRPRDVREALDRTAYDRQVLLDVAHGTFDRLTEIRERLVELMETTPTDASYSWSGASDATVYGVDMTAPPPPAEDEHARAVRRFRDEAQAETLLGGAPLGQWVDPGALAIEIAGIGPGTYFERMQHGAGPLTLDAGTAAMARESLDDLNDRLGGLFFTYIAEKDRSVRELQDWQAAARDFRDLYVLVHGAEPERVFHQPAEWAQRAVDTVDGDVAMIVDPEPDPNEDLPAYVDVGVTRIKGHYWRERLQAIGTVDGTTNAIEQEITEWCERVGLDRHKVQYWPLRAAGIPG